MAERKVFWIYAYLIRCTTTGRLDTFNTTAERGFPSNAVIVRGGSREVGMRPPSVE